MRPAMLDRLTLTPERVAGIVDGVRQVAALPDPIGRVDKMETRPNGLIIGRRRVPLGVIAIIFEARPNVTVDAAALCLKSGNVCILRGGKEAIRSNRCVAELMRQALRSVGLPEDCISLVQDTSHETANELMHLDGYVDVLIPRGGAGLIRAVAKEMLRQVSEVAPTLFVNAGPSCVSGPCPEGKMSCGKMADIREEYRQLREKVRHAAEQ